jgi:putative FmdB family regulatory protein
MPIYEYLCKSCGRHFERRQSISEEPLRLCEECGGALEKQWSLSGFQFKGAGWYVTDYSGKKPGGDASAEKTSTAESTSAADTASNTKSDTTSAPPPSSEKGSSKK